MARTRTRAELRDAARNLADEVNSDFITDTQANFMLDQAVAALWDKISIVDPDRFLRSVNLSATSGTKSYDLTTLASDFFKIRGVDLVSGTTRASLKRYEFAERNLYQHSDVWLIPTERTSVRYRVAGSALDGASATLYFEPDPGTNTYTVWYVSAPDTFDDDPDTIDGGAGWEDFIIYTVAAEMVAKGEGDPTFLLMRLADVERRILASAPDRDAGLAPRVQDTRSHTSLWD